MPLHLLGKKSWNVYNTDNVERVRRDEAQAQAREEAEEQRMQEEDAQRRIAVLRGEDIAPLPTPASGTIDQSQPTDPSKSWREHRKDDTYTQRDLKRKRRRGEDDTDRDMRYALTSTTTATSRKTHELLKSKDKDAPLSDHAGHIQLIPAPDTTAIRKAEKNAEVEAEKAKKRKKDEDQYTMRFSNAGGFQTGMGKPWYAATSAPAAATSTSVALSDVQNKDVWGNEDPRRKERELGRISSSDPFAAMKQAQRQLKQSERDKESWDRKQRDKIEEMRREEKRERHSQRKRDEMDDLDGFSLDAPRKGKDGDSRHDGHRRHRHHHRHRRRSRSRSK